MISATYLRERFVPASLALAVAWAADGRSRPSSWVSRKITPHVGSPMAFSAAGIYAGHGHLVQALTGCRGGGSNKASRVCPGFVCVVLRLRFGGHLLPRFPVAVRTAVASLLLLDSLSKKGIERGERCVIDSVQCRMGYSGKHCGSINLNKLTFHSWIPADTELRRVSVTRRTNAPNRHLVKPLYESPRSVSVSPCHFPAPLPPCPFFLHLVAGWFDPHRPPPRLPLPLATFRLMVRVCVCSYCHAEDRRVIPHRVVHHWDFATHRVGKDSRAFLDATRFLPVFDLPELSPALFTEHEVRSARC